MLLIRFKVLRLVSVRKLFTIKCLNLYTKISVPDLVIMLLTANIFSKNSVFCFSVKMQEAMRHFMAN